MGGLNGWMGSERWKVGGRVVKEFHGPEGCKRGGSSGRRLEGKMREM